MSTKSCANPRAAKNACAVLLLAAISGFAACHGNRPWRSTATQPANISANANACAISEEEEVGLSEDLSTDVSAAADYSGTVADILKAGKFEALDCVADRARKRKERFPGGSWKLHELYKGVSAPVQHPVHATQEDWDVLLKRLGEWVTARPRSTTARVALASAYVGYAADIRGNGPANTVSEDGWKIFKERTTKAGRILQEAATLPTKCPERYLVMQRVAQNLNWSDAKKRDLFKRATKFEPEYFYYAQELAANLLPKSGGKPGALEKFADQIAARAGGDQGDIIYFEVATAKSVMCGRDDDPHLSLARIERGFEAIEKLYGVSMVNLNRIAFLTARTQPGDAIYADKVMKRIDEQRDEETWTSEDFVFAKNYAAFMGPRLAIEMAADANMKTPKGISYKAFFEKPYRELVQRCVGPADGDVGTFKALTMVGENGTVEDVRIYWNSPASMCLYEKLHALQLEKANAFPPPPQAQYWVRLDVNWADFAPVASK